MWFYYDRCLRCVFVASIAVLFCIKEVPLIFAAGEIVFEGYTGTRNGTIELSDDHNAILFDGVDIVAELQNQQSTTDQGTSLNSQVETRVVGIADDVHSHWSENWSVNFNRFNPIGNWNIYYEQMWSRFDSLASAGGGKLNLRAGYVEVYEAPSGAVGDVFLRPGSRGGIYTPFTYNYDEFRYAHSSYVVSNNLLASDKSFHVNNNNQAVSFGGANYVVAINYQVLEPGYTIETVCVARDDSLETEFIVLKDLGGNIFEHVHTLITYFPAGDQNCNYVVVSDTYTVPVDGNVYYLGFFSAGGNLRGYGVSQRYFQNPSRVVGTSYSMPSQFMGRPEVGLTYAAGTNLTDMVMYGEDVDLIHMPSYAQVTVWLVGNESDASRGLLSQDDLNTEVVVELSRDNRTTWTPATLQMGPRNYRGQFITGLVDLTRSGEGSIVTYRLTASANVNVGVFGVAVQTIYDQDYGTTYNEESTAASSETDPEAKGVADPNYDYLGTGGTYNSFGGAHYVLALNYFSLEPDRTIGTVCVSRFDETLNEFYVLKELEPNVYEHVHTLISYVPIADGTCVAEAVTSQFTIPNDEYNYYLGFFCEGGTTIGSSSWTYYLQNPSRNVGDTYSMSSTFQLRPQVGVTYL